MKTIVTIIFLLTFTPSFSQTNEVTLNKKKKQNIEISYSSGELKEKGKKKLMKKLSSTNSGRINGVMAYFKHGKWIEFYKNGKKKRIVIYNKDEIVSVKKEWDENGNRIN